MTAAKKPHKGRRPVPVDWNGAVFDRALAYAFAFYFFN
jgi:hypothetical protein